MTKNAKRKNNKKGKQGGFTLIELLAVITIMGILMMVAIPAVSRTIENSRRDTFANTAKAYIDAVKNAVSTDELKCNTTTAAFDQQISATPAGKTYYVNIATAAQAAPNEYISQQTTDLMESGGKSSWGNSDVKGYVAITKTTDNNRTTYKYNILLVDIAGRGIQTLTTDGESSVKRSKVIAATAGSGNYNGVAFKVASTTVNECKVDN